MNNDQKEYAEFWNEILIKSYEIKAKYDKLSDNNKTNAEKDARKMIVRVRDFKELTDYIRSHFC